MKCMDIHNVSLRIGSTQILDNLSFSIRSGTIHALIGDNGAGKTSLLRIILGLTPSYEGKILVNSTTKLESYRHHMGAVIDSIVPDMKSSCSRYLHNVCYMLGTDDTAFESNLLEKVGLQHERKKIISRFSLGMKRRLMIACALASNPKFLVLDEPFNGIDPKGMNEMRLLLRRLKSDGVTILITSHIISELLKVADVYSIMYNGTVVDTISSTELAKRQMYKVVFTPKDTTSFVGMMKSQHPELLCVASSDDTVSIYNMTIDKAYTTGIVESNNIEQHSMSEEDILLWKMSGYQAKDFS